MMKRILMLLMVAVMIAGPVEIEAKRTHGRHHKITATTKKKSKSRKGSGGRTVYICTGSYATKYHSTPYCTGLNRCSGSVVARTSTGGYSPCARCH